MKNIFLVTILLTLSSCMVSQKTFDDKCCALECEIQELKSQTAGLELKEQLMKQVVIDLYDVVDSLKVKNDTIK
tara:strand:- start:280 stop:501 length:222 start_codon:yes stop_codon:yes gene_type:complete